MKSITTKYMGPTNFRGSRIKASDEDGNQVTIGYESDLSSDAAHDKAAIALCRKMGWTHHGLVRGGTKRGNVYVFDIDSERVPLKALLAV